jgi:hypothetical protein
MLLVPQQELKMQHREERRDEKFHHDEARLRHHHDSYVLECYTSSNYDSYDKVPKC